MIAAPSLSQAARPGRSENAFCVNSLIGRADAMVRIDLIDTTCLKGLLWSLACVLAAGAGLQPWRRYGWCLAAAAPAGSPLRCRNRARELPAPRPSTTTPIGPRPPPPRSRINGHSRASRPLRRPPASLQVCMATRPHLAVQAPGRDLRRRPACIRHRFRNLPLGCKVLPALTCRQTPAWHGRPPRSPAAPDRRRLGHTTRLRPIRQRIRRPRLRPNRPGRIQLRRPIPIREQT